MANDLIQNGYLFILYALNCSTAEKLIDPLTQITNEQLAAVRHLEKLVYTYKLPSNWNEFNPQFQKLYLEPENAIAFAEWRKLEALCSYIEQ